MINSNSECLYDISMVNATIQLYDITKQGRCCIEMNLIYCNDDNDFKTLKMSNEFITEIKPLKFD